MKFVFSAFANAAYQGKIITAMGYDRQLLSFYDLGVKDMLGVVGEYVAVGWLKAYEAKTRPSVEKATRK